MTSVIHIPSLRKLTPATSSSAGSAHFCPTCAASLEVISFFHLLTPLSLLRCHSLLSSAEIVVSPNPQVMMRQILKPNTWGLFRIQGILASCLFLLSLPLGGKREYYQALTSSLRISGDRRHLTISSSISGFTLIDLLAPERSLREKVKNYFLSFWFLKPQTSFYWSALEIKHKGSVKYWALIEPLGSTPKFMLFPHDYIFISELVSFATFTYPSTRLESGLEMLLPTRFSLKTPGVVVKQRPLKMMTQMPTASPWLALNCQWWNKHGTLQFCILTLLSSSLLFPVQKIYCS